jgi:hypothetical protein
MGLRPHAYRFATLLDRDSEVPNVKVVRRTSTRKATRRVHLFDVSFFLLSRIAKGLRPAVTVFEGLTWK